MTVRHAGGPTIDGATLSLAGHTGGSTAFNDNSDYSAGNSVTANVCTDDTVDVVWESDGDSAILATYRGPDA